MPVVTAPFCSAKMARLYGGLMLMAGLTLPAQAADGHLDFQKGAQELRDSCQSELRRYCSSETLTVQPQMSCLHKYYLNLSLSCRIALKHRAPQSPASS